MLYDDPPSADEDVARLRLALRGVSFATLLRYGVVTYDRDEHLVRKGPRFDAAASPSDRSNENRDEAPATDRHATRNSNEE